MFENDLMPEPLRRAIRDLVSEAMDNLQEVLSHSQPHSRDWKRMPLYRLTDAADLLNICALVQAA
ncbi:hypothetical protein ACFYNO_32810 [Kitasatospora sp. NPDC006697]|uniref:hypothetical protein n=1 Tax=Kitasatospora sp. NPDC006697 TaxID=3364020 RepID=UPI0036CA62AD